MPREDRSSGVPFNPDRGMFAKHGPTPSAEEIDGTVMRAASRAEVGELFVPGLNDRNAWTGKVFDVSSHESHIVSRHPPPTESFPVALR